MPTKILMPALSPTMTEGKLATWQKKEGDTIEAGDVIAEIETDKATMEVEAVDEGTLGKIVVPAGTDAVAVNSVIGIILDEGEDASALDDIDTGAATAPDPAPPPDPTPAPATPTAASAAAPAAPGVPTDGKRIIASPLAKRIAANEGLDLSAVSGSGPHGRIIKRDVEAALASGGAKAPAADSQSAAAPAASAPAPQIDDSTLPPFEDLPNSSMRKVIAKRLSESKQSVPHFYLTVDCELDNLLALRKELNSRSDDYKISVNDFVIRAAAITLGKVPGANAMWAGDSIKRFNRADISVAVSIPDGLITPVIRDAGSKGLIAISNEMKELAAKAREGKLMPEEYQGGTMSVSNLGMYGIKNFSAIINPPQGCILAVGAGEQRPVVKDGALAVATVMSVTLAVDHRVIDGALGAEYLAAFKPLIEDPVNMLL
ncbi:MAG: pyruvate dehydrogenase complex dihydrolipoamide acetyltransferase [Rhodospirillales bacterium]